MRRASILIVAFSLAPLAAACADDGDPASHIEPADLLARIEAGEAPTIVDVRSRGEFEQGHVPGAIHVPFWLAFSRASGVPGARDAPIVLYCEHGPRAGVAKAAFRFRGFEKVVYLRGHMSGWKSAGLPVETTPDED